MTPLSRGFPAWRDLWTASDELDRAGQALNQLANEADLGGISDGMGLRSLRDELYRVSSELNGVATLLGAPMFMVETHPLNPPRIAVRRHATRFQAKET